MSIREPLRLIIFDEVISIEGDTHQFLGGDGTRRNQPRRIATERIAADVREAEVRRSFIGGVAIRGIQ